MKLSINPLMRGKVAKTEVSALESLYAWTSVDVSAEDAFALITEDGYATTCELTSGSRKERNFASRQLFMVDVDDGMTIDELLADDFYNAYGLGFYATASFTPEHHKFRILFMTESVITTAQESRQIIRALRKIYPLSDPACVDPARLFYGCINCELKEYTGLHVPDDIVSSLIDIVKQEDLDMADAMANQPQVEYTMTDGRRKRILELLRGCFVGNYPIWRNIGWGLKSGGFSLQDFQYVTQGMMRQKTAKDAQDLWNDGSINGAITMGSVIHFLKERAGKDCLRYTEEDVIQQCEDNIAKTITDMRTRMKKWQE